MALTTQYKIIKTFLSIENILAAVLDITVLARRVSRHPMDAHSMYLFSYKL